MEADARLRIGRRGIVEVMAPAPFAFREHGGIVHAVQAAGGPLGGDRLHLAIEVLTGASATIRSVAAQLVQPGPDGDEARLTNEVIVHEGASLDWAPEPTVLVAGCRLMARTTIEVRGDACIRWRDELVLGRHGEAAGEADIVLRVLVGGRAVVHHQPDLSPFGVGSNRVLSSTVVCSPAGSASPGPHWLAAADPHTWVRLALGPTLAHVRRPDTDEVSGCGPR